MSAAEPFDLDAIEIADTPAEPSVVFRLDGRDWHCREREQLPVLVIEQLMGQGSLLVESFFRNLLIPAHVQDFVALLHRPDCPLTLPRAQSLMQHLSEQVLNRPTVRSGLSGRGPQKTGATSKGGLSSPATRRKRRAS
jgi:hypothetical protein